MGVGRKRRRRTLPAEERLALIVRVAEHCFDYTETWETVGSGDGLAYLFWAIAANDGQPFDTTVAPEKYRELVAVLRSRRGLWGELAAIGAIA